MRKVSISDIVEKPIAGEWGVEPDDYSIGIPVIRNTNFSNDGRIELHDVAYRKISDKKIQKKKLYPGDIIIEKSGGSKNQPVGRVVFFDIDEDQEYLYSNFTSVIRPKKNVNSKYVHYGLLYSYLRGKSELFQNKTTGIRNLKLNRYLKKVQIPVPSLDKQKTVVKKLDKAQRLIDIESEMERKYNDLIKSVFLEMFGDPFINPKEWEETKIKNLGKIVLGNTPPKKDPENYGDEVEWVKTSNINENSIHPSEAEEFLSKRGKKLGRVIPQKSLIVCCIAGSLSSIGKCAITDREIAINQQINAIVPNSKVVNINFLYSLLLVSQELIQDASTKSMKGMVSKTKFKEIELILPDIDSQKKFSEIFEKIIVEKHQLIFEAKKSKKLFSSLLQGTFS